MRIYRAHIYIIVIHNLFVFIKTQFSVVGPHLRRLLISFPEKLRVLATNGIGCYFIRTCLYTRNAKTIPVYLGATMKYPAARKIITMFSCSRKTV